MVHARTGPNGSRAAALSLSLPQMSPSGTNQLATRSRTSRSVDRDRRENEHSFAFVDVRFHFTRVVRIRFRRYFISSPSQFRCELTIEKNPLSVDFHFKMDEIVGSVVQPVKTSDFFVGHVRSDSSRHFSETRSSARRNVPCPSS